MNNTFSNPPPHGTPPAPFITWIKAGNQVLLGWAATLTWTRLFILALIVMIASSWISDRLDLHHGHETVKTQVDVDTHDDADAGDEVLTENVAGCANTEITIGSQKFVVVCESTTTTTAAKAPANAASAAASAPVGTASATTTTVREDRSYDLKIKPVAVKKTQTTTENRVMRTAGGVIGDLGSALFIAFFAYLIAAKIIVRKSAESEAKVREATKTAEHEALERQLAQARLKLLQAQVEPHFLFNTLAAVDYLIETDPPRASVMQKQLITYLRGALPQMREDSSTLGREVSLVRAYLELLKMRIEDRLDFVIEVPDNLSGADFPPMVLQSLIENAIKHGIEPKPEGGKITLHAQARDGNLWVDVVDTGMGLPEGDVFGKSTNGTGLGLENIRKRLALLYPNASRIELRSEIPSGTSVRIMIPYQTDAARPGKN